MVSFVKRLGLKYRHETFGDRNAVEGFFSQLKERRDYRRYFHTTLPSTHFRAG